jgi:threonine/homoserine/homoserine lactone efflux protein
LLVDGAYPHAGTGTVTDSAGDDLHGQPVRLAVRRLLMAPGDHLVAFVLIAFVLIVAPGPSVLFVVTRSLTLGRGAGVGTAIGNAAGVYVQAIAVAFGLGALVRESILAFTVIKLCGAAYLVFLGVQAVRHRHSLVAALALPVAPKLLRRVLVDGFLVGVFNPKVIVFFMAVLPQFVDRASGSATSQLLVLGAIFCAIAVVCDSVWALLAGTARAWLVSSPRRLAAIGGSGGLVMIGLGAGLAVSGRPKS